MKEIKIKKVWKIKLIKIKGKKINFRNLFTNKNLIPIKNY